MPYIEQEARQSFHNVLQELETLVNRLGISNGELSYLISRVVLLYLKRHGTSYNTLSDVVKALECVKLEFYRRTMASYNDYKCAKCGDVGF